MRLPWQMSDLHPHALSLIDTDMADDFAGALAADLDMMNPPAIIDRFRCVFEQGEHTAALIENGFHVVRLTRMIDLPFTVLDHPALCADAPADISTHWFQLEERAPWDQWIDQHWRHYTVTHHSNPPEVPKSGLRDVFVGDDLVEALALRAGPQGRVRAFSSLRDSEEIGWIGGLPDLLSPTLAATLRRAAAMGWSKASIEVDDDDTALWSLIDQLDLPATQTFVTWHRERDPTRRPN